MPASILFWVIMLIWLIFGLWSAWPIGRGSVPTLLLFILLALLGWKVFGPVLQ